MSSRFTPVFGLVLLAACDRLPAEPEPDRLPSFPAQSDWLECGPILAAGVEGEWDRHLWGGFASSALKRDGLFHLYYQGARGFDVDEASVTWRSIGLATSEDGFRFTKHHENPVLTWFPNDELEEGAASGGAFLGPGGEVNIYYGANTWAGGGEVNADGRLAVAADGVAFSDLGVVLDRTDGSVWGSGDELFPIIGVHDDGRWFTWYIPNGVPEEGLLGVAWGSNRDELTQSAAARSGGDPVSAWGPGSLIPLGAGTHALFLNDVRAAGGPRIELRTVSTDVPFELSAPVRSYRFEDVWEAVVLLDRDAGTWFMYYRGVDHARYGLKVAAADHRKASCPR